jgi:hypothetical protein
VLLGACFCEQVLVGVAVAEPLLTLVNVRFAWRLTSFPMPVDTGIVACTWLLPPGRYQLEVGLIAPDQRVISDRPAAVETPATKIHTSLHRLGIIDFPAPGQYILAGNINGVVAGGVPIYVGPA